MARPGSSVLTALAVWVACAPIALAAETSDPEGDGETQRFGTPRDLDATDIVHVEGFHQNGTLRLSMTMAGDLPVAGEAEEQRRYTYLFIVAPGQGEAPLYGEANLTATCQFHRGMQDLECQVSQGDATLRGIGIEGARLTARLDVPWSGPLRVGGAAHESLPNGTQRDILVQDFTTNALPPQPTPTEDAGAPGATPTPWWRTPWVLLVALGIVVLGAWAWSQRPRR